jgi:Tfp pilus assembly protein PilN
MNRPADIQVQSDQANALPVGGKSSSPLREKKQKGGVVIERPGVEKGSWQRWYLPDGSGLDPSLLSQESPMPQQSLRVVALPSVTLFAWPLWIATEGNSSDLVRMELSGRHLLKRGMEESLSVVPILERGNRRLVLAVGPDEPFPNEQMPHAWKDAARFELPSRLFNEGATTDLILWSEWETLQMALYREGRPVWFCEIREEGLPGHVRRIALRLLAEGVLDHPPREILIEGMSGEWTSRCASALSTAFPEARIRRHPASPHTPPSPPALPQDACDFPTAEAKAARISRVGRKRLLSYAVVAGVFYLVLLLWGAGDLVIHRLALGKIQREISLIEAPTAEARAETERWHSLRSSVDPDTYALDLLAAVAAPTDGGKVRLTRFSLDGGRIQISGEATDVTQAYGFIEQLKKSPLLQEYEWNSAQPQLAGKNSVRFDMEGNRPDTNHETPSP